MAQASKKGTRNKNQLRKGVVHIHATFNNTIITITDLMGDTITWCSAGSLGFKGTRKGTPYAAQKAAEKATLDAISMGMKTVKVLTKGQGSGRESAIKTLFAKGFKVSVIEDITPTAHNGCRPPKRRRV